MHKIIVCTVCPMSCSVVFELDENNEILSVTGNRCPRGKTYAIKEHTAPERISLQQCTLREVSCRFCLCAPTSPSPKSC